MSKSYSSCPHCNKPILILPLSAGTAIDDTAPGGTIFESSAHSPFENTAATAWEPDRTIHIRGGFWVALWRSEGGLGILTGCFVFAGTGFLAWWYSWPMFVPVSVALVAGISTIAAKLILYVPPKPKPAPPEKIVKVTVDSPLDGPNAGRRIQWEETFLVPAATMSHIANVCIEQGRPFSRRNCLKRGVCSQTQFEAVQETMLLRQWAKRDESHPQGGVTLNRHGRAVLRGVLRG